LTDSDKHAPLSGITVVDFTALGPGPFFTQCLVDLGADVIKIERPPIGDMGRLISPGGHHALNRGKQTLWVDMKTPDGLASVKELLKTADVVAEGFRPGVMQRLCLSFESVAQENPGLVYVSISGFGQTGPFVKEPGHDLNYLAASGFLSMTQGVSGGPGHTMGVPIGDFCGSLYALSSTLAALMQKRLSGKGQWLDVSLVDCLTHMMNSSIGHFQMAKLETLEEQRHSVFSKPAYGVFQTRNGKHLAIGALEDSFWLSLVGCLDLEISDLETNDFEARTASADEINRRVALAVSTHDADDLVHRLRGADVPVMPMVAPNELPTSAHAVARGLFNETDGIRYASFPVKLTGTGM